jgi:DNA-binding beta-propeller fold protein YncE
MILLNSFDIMTNGNYRLYVQRTDGSAPVLVGEGAGTGFSTDGKWVTAVDPVNSERASVIPTGVGETKTLQAPTGLQYLGLALLPDGKRLLISVVGPGASPHCALQDIESGAVSPVGPASRYVPVFAGRMTPGPSPDGKYCVLTEDKNHYWLQPLTGVDAREIQGINPGDLLLEWHNDSNNLFVSRAVRSDFEIYNLNLTTGERKLWTRFSPADKTAIAGNTWAVITPDGAHYGYLVQRLYSILFLAEGLR